MKTTDNAKAQTILQALDWVEEVTTDEDSLIVSAPLDRTTEIAAALGKQEIYVAELVPIETSLEEYFLQVTGDNGSS